jgi:hypothetical protein
MPEMHLSLLGQAKGERQRAKEEIKMQFIVYDDKVQKTQEAVFIVDFKKLSRDIERRPEDYIFILTPKEYSKYQELNEQLMAGFQGKPMNIDEQAFTQQYQGVFIIATLAPKPSFAKRYLIADVTKHELVGDNHIVFYVNRKEQYMDRTQEVLRRIAEAKAEMPRHAEQ